MAMPLRVLIVEDSEDDADIMAAELRQGGFEPTWERVASAEAMEAALDKDDWDLVLSDYVLPGFDGLQAFKLLQNRGIDLPFIIVSGTIGEETAVKAMKAGVHDYLRKGNLARLNSAIERELRESRLRKKHRELEQQLLQSQKMEVVGQFAGELAHDFNNLLAIVQGYAEMTLAKIDETDPCYDPMKEIHEAGKRAAGFTQQLLAFSRKQILQPKVLNLNALISKLGRMLKRLIGEPIDLQLRLGQDLGQVKVDPGQIEQVLLNLSLNARDAMPRTGKLVIETSLVDLDLDEKYVRSHPGAMAGPHVRITVSDTGEGMNPATMEHIFEPFFTTKGVGKGTGLGLSTVYGIVKQSGGHIQVASQLGEGTTFTIDLPRIQGTPEKGKPVPRQPIGMRHRKETLILVEDEAALRKMMAESLRLMGYTVLEAGTPNEALVLSEQQGTIDLILTDVIMPQMSGPELVQKLSKIRPVAKVLYMSGYTDNPILVNEVVEKKRPFIQKPFPLAALSAMIRRVLDNAGGGAR